MRGKATRKEQDQVDAQALGWNRLFILVVLILIVIVIGLETGGDFYCCFCYCYCFFSRPGRPQSGHRGDRDLPPLVQLLSKLCVYLIIANVYFLVFCSLFTVLVLIDSYIVCLVKNISLSVLWNIFTGCEVNPGLSCED